jgi:putative transposase
VPQRRKKKRLTGIGVAVGAMSPIRPNVLWAIDFQFNATADGRTMKMLNVIDEFTREALAIEVDRGIDADGVVDVLDRLVREHGAPTYVRFDNGPEFVAHAVSDWCRFNSAVSLFIDPGSPWQNAWIESFNGRPATRRRWADPFERPLTPQAPPTCPWPRKSPHWCQVEVPTGGH